MGSRGILCVFAKPPVPGSVKTRLAAKVGDAGAAALARAFLRDTWQLVTSIAWATPVLATTEDCGRALDLPGTPTLWLQGEGDLGARIERIARRGLSEADFVIAIGADSPGLPKSRILEARELLERTDAVLGPSDDGGFYLIGLRGCPSGLFDGLPWSTTGTFSAMRERLEHRGMTVSLLDRWFDVDTPEDLDRLATMMDLGEIAAEETASALAARARGRVSCR